MQLVRTMITKEKKNQNQYRLPILILVNGILYTINFCVNGFCVRSILYCFMTSLLIEVGIEDEKTKHISLKWNGLLLLIGIFVCIGDRPHIKDHMLGMFCVSFALFVLFVLSKGAAIGGGDVKLMGAAGLILGLEQSVYALFIGCALAVVCYLVRWKKIRTKQPIAMGPYLAISIWVCAIWSLH